MSHMVMNDDSSDGTGPGHGAQSGARERYRGHRGRRKERVLHTRISEELAEDIRRIAEDLRVPVSNIVRNVLEEAFSVVERMTDDVGDLVEEVVDEAEAARERIAARRRHRERRRDRQREPRDAGGPGDEVLGWQPLVLHRPQLCRLCGASLERGESAFVSLTGGGVGTDFACEACVRG